MLLSKSHCLKDVPPYSASMTEIHQSADVLTNWIWCLWDFTILSAESGPRWGQSLDENTSLIERAHLGAPRCGGHFSATLTSSFEPEGNVLNGEIGKHKWTLTTSHSVYNPDHNASLVLGTSPQPTEVSFLSDFIHCHPSLTDKAVKTPEKIS